MTLPIEASQVPPKAIASVYPKIFAERMIGRTKRALGDYFGLTKFGVNLTELAPGASSALLHRHTLQEEFIYILSGHPVLLLDERQLPLSPGMCYGFKPSAEAHRLFNPTAEKVVYLEIGDRAVGDEVTYPDDDLIARMDENRKWVITRKDGSSY